MYNTGHIKTYRYDLTEEHFEGVDPRVKHAFNLQNGDLKEITRARFLSIQKKYGKHYADTGGKAVQGAVLCERTINLMNHC